ncbi:MAG TPA: BatA domain-containing protein [Candidatus Nitrosotalea sp.]|nr:BatA domain-containing protein [Candidatus Nitrosotalea sp.]
MSFLAPLFLVGAFAIALPVVFHLIRRTSRDQMPFSSLMFLRPTPPRVTRRNRLEHIVLLILRCLVFCLLALAFARPFFKQPTAADRPSDSGRMIILLVDTSASMRREGLWPAALAQAKAALNSTSPADRVAIFTFDRQTRRLVNFEDWASMNVSSRAAESAARLDGIKPGWSSTHLGGALIAAAEAFADADPRRQNNGVRQIVLISDLQEGSHLDGLQGYDWPRGVEVAVEPLRSKHPTNAGLQWVLDAETGPAVDGQAGPRVRVSNSSDAKREQFQVRWSGVTGAPVVEAYVPPGQSRILQAPKLPAGSNGEKLELSGDDEDFDNTVHLIQPEPQHVNVVFVGNETEKDPAESLYYLKRAFQQTRRQDINVTVVSSESPLSSAVLGDTRLVIASGPLPDASVAVVQQFLTNGGTALFLIKSANAARTLGQLAGVENFSATESGGGGYSMLGQIDFEHPLFAPFADPRFSDFTKVHFWKHRVLDASALPGARALAKYDNGDPAILEIPKGKGRLLIFTSGWQPADSQLALSSKFVPLLYSILDQAGGIQARPTQFVVGDDANLAALGASEPLVIQKPDGNQVRLKPGESRFPETDLPGIYAVVSTQPPFHFAVNLDASESRTAPLPTEELERLGVPLKMREIEIAKELAQKRRLHEAELENQQKLWRWLIVAALVVLLTETWLAGWLTRPAVRQTEAGV